MQNDYTALRNALQSKGYATTNALLTRSDFDQLKELCLTEVEVIFEAANSCTGDHNTLAGHSDVLRMPYKGSMIAKPSQQWTVRDKMVSEAIQKLTPSLEKICGASLQESIGGPDVVWYLPGMQVNSHDHTHQAEFSAVLILEDNTSKPVFQVFDHGVWRSVVAPEGTLIFMNAETVHRVKVCDGTRATLVFDYYMA